MPPTPPSIALNARATASRNNPSNCPAAAHRRALVYNRGMSTSDRLIHLLADGAVHSGRAMGETLGLSRAAVCKAVKRLQGEGLAVESLGGRGYRLRAPLSLLSAPAIQDSLPTCWRALEVTVLREVDSTNAWVVAAGRERLACLAERQTAGRGRRGRAWLATPYRNILLSLGWRFDIDVAHVAGLSLAVGLAALNALEAVGVEGLALKWPNDILRHGRKLAGLLIELRAEAGGPTFAVIGLGVNVRVDADEGKRIEQAWADLADLPVIDRNALAAGLLAGLCDCCERFAREGFAPIRAAWDARHAYQGRAVRLIQGARTVEGTVQGVDAQGALVLRIDGHDMRFDAGEVSLRPL